MDYRHKPLRHRTFRGRRAFTLIEVLIVIAVIGILVTIAILGFRALQKGASADQTKTMLGNAASMFAEYDAKTSLKAMPSNVWDLAGIKIATPAGYNIWRDANPAAMPAGEQRLTGPGNVDPEEPTDRLGVAVRNTSLVMAEMMKVPGVKSIFAQIPVEKTMVVGVPTGGGAYAPVHEAQPVLLDGWGNPIIFVPAAGLNVTLAAPTPGDPPVTYVITSVKNYAPAALPSGTLAPGARPFFASAGPDGVFGLNPGPDGSPGGGDDVAGGDDNIYSFQN